MFSSTVKFAIFAVIPVALILLSTQSVSAQVHKWVDEQGNVHYTDNPDLAKEKSKGRSKQVIREKKKPKPKPQVTYTEPVVEGEVPAEETPDVEKKEEPPEEKSPAQGAVELVGDVEIVPALSGMAMIRATVRNTFDKPVDGVRLDVALFHVNHTRAMDMVIPFKGGPNAPGRLAPGETGVIEGVTELLPEDVAGWRYRVVWAYSELVPEPGPGQPAPEGVRHLIHSKKTGKLREAEEGEKPGAKPEEKGGQGQ